jgi:hypothetical protein
VDRHTTAEHDLFGRRVNNNRMQPNFYELERASAADALKRIINDSAEFGRVCSFSVQ